MGNCVSSRRVFRRLEEDDEEADGKGYVLAPGDDAEYSLCYLLGLSCFALTNGLTFGSMGLIILPAECERIWPETQAIALGMLLAMVGSTQLVAPIAGYLSDRCTHPLGRRYYTVGNFVVLSRPWQLHPILTLTLALIADGHGSTGEA